MENGKDLGNVKNAKFELIKPMKMNVESMDFNSLTLMVGANGSGKTMINKLVYFASMVTFLDVSKLKVLEVQKTFDFTQVAQYIFENTFSSPEELEGSITAHFVNGTFTCEVKDGILSKIQTSYDANVKTASYPKYMSTSTRLFSQVESILAMSKGMGEEATLKHYRIYDLLHCEGLKNFALNRSSIDEQIVEQFKNNYDFDVVKLTFNESKGQFYYTDSKDKTRLVSSLGAGHQSILNMFVGTLY